MKFKINLLELGCTVRGSFLKAHDNVDLDDVTKCPYCDEFLRVSLPSISKLYRKELTRCYRCSKDFVIDAKVESVIVRYDIKLKKVGK